MTLHAAMMDACNAVGIVPPHYTKLGQWVKCPVKGKSAANGSGRVMVFDDGKGGICWNWTTGEQQRFSESGLAGRDEIKAPPRDLEAERRAEAERMEVERICGLIIAACAPGIHPYLAKKGFPDFEGLVCEDPRSALPRNAVGEMIEAAMPKCDKPLLIVPGRIGKRLTTVQFITAEGDKKNILRGQMSGTAHRVGMGRETWVCEGIATALSVNAALRLLGRSATVLSAFAASNVGKVASGISGAIVAADNDKPVETLGGVGTGKYYAVKSGCVWVMPPERGDFNDFHQADGLRAVALHLRGIGMG